MRSNQLSYSPIVCVLYHPIVKRANLLTFGVWASHRNQVFPLHIHSASQGLESTRKCARFGYKGSKTLRAEPFDFAQDRPQDEAWFLVAFLGLSKVQLLGHRLQHLIYQVYPGFGIVGIGNRPPVLFVLLCPIGVGDVD